MAMVRSEVTGAVISILVQPGDSVREGDELVITESMKMEVPVFSPIAGTVRAVNAAVGGTVEEGDEVVEIMEDGDVS